MPANEWLGKIAEAVGSRSLEETREHIQEYFQATNHEGVMPASLMSMHEQQYNNQPVQIIHPNAIIECAMPLPIQQPPRLSPRCFARIKQQQQTLLGAYCAAAEWTREEQIVLEEGLKRFPASQYNNLTRYVKIAAFLPDKTITDVAKRYKWMVELQRLNSINFSDDSEGGRELPASPSESSTLHQSTGGSFAPNGDQIDPILVSADTKNAPAGNRAAASTSPARAARDSQDTVTSESGVMRLLDENDSFIAKVKKSLAAQPDGATVDGDIMENMIRFRSNLSNVLNCLAMVSGCMSKMPPLLVKLHPLPIIEAEENDTKAPAAAAPAASQPALAPAQPAAAAAAAEPETGAVAGAAAASAAEAAVVPAEQPAAVVPVAAATTDREDGVGEETPAESAEETGEAEGAAGGAAEAVEPQEDDADADADASSPSRRSKRKRKRR